MKPAFRPHRAALLAVASSAFLLSGCNEEKDAEIERLTEELEIAKQELSSERETRKFTEDRFEKTLDELADAKSEVSKLQADARVAERELERFRHREEAEREAEENKPTREEMAAAGRAAAEKNLAARVTITGDKSNGSGLIVEDGGKSWIYFALATLDGNSKLTITASDGTEITKFGTFEIDPATELARLEVTQEVPMKLTLPGELPEMKSSTTLISVDETGKLLEGRAYSAVEGTTVRADSRITAAPSGSPVFLGETSAPFGMVLDPPKEDKVLWEDDYRGSRASGKSVALIGVERKWSAIPIATYLDEARILAEMDKTTRLVFAFGAIDVSGSTLTYGSIPNSPDTVQEILEKDGTPELTRSLKDLEEWLKTKGQRASSSDLERQVSRVFGEIQVISNRQNRALATRKFSEVHADEAKQSMEWRKEADEALTKAMNPTE